MTRKKPRRRIIAKPASSVTVAPTPWDMGATGPANRDRLREEEAVEIDPTTGRKQPNPNGVRRVRRVCVIEEYAKGGLITSMQLAAGANLRAMSEGVREKDPLCALELGVTAKGSMLKEELHVDRRRQFWKVWAVIPPECRTVVEWAAINDLPLQELIGARMFDQLDAFAKLRVGLQAVIDGER